MDDIDSGMSSMRNVADELQRFDNHREKREFLLCEKCQIAWEFGSEMGSAGKNYATIFTKTILESIESQINNNDPPETRQTVERLVKKGHTAEEARRSVSSAVTVELFHVHYDRKPFNKERFLWNLAQLPRKPWDKQGVELYNAAK